MDNKKCFQCNNELFSKVGGDAIKCPICGALNEGAEQHKNKIVSKHPNKKRKSVDGSLIGGIIGGSLGE